MEAGDPEASAAEEKRGDGGVKGEERYPRQRGTQGGGRRRRGGAWR